MEREGEVRLCSGRLEVRSKHPSHGCEHALRLGARLFTPIVLLRQAWRVIRPPAPAPAPDLIHRRVRDEKPG